MHVKTGKNRCNNYKVVAIRCYCNDKKVIGSRCNKLRSNRFMQQKNLVAINFRYCNNLRRRGNWWSAVIFLCEEYGWTRRVKIVVEVNKYERISTFAIESGIQLTNWDNPLGWRWWALQLLSFILLLFFFKACLNDLVIFFILACLNDVNG